ncbi:ABC transporter permease [Citricoccus muralis]|uniref:Transport permease protein n=1 Tax=Citricoccus muralis TaxID=169134 RepID=A0ABY8H9D2_9MICC|nr:ABC transporter permease [Citricoccus muralis]WFP17768.1 ABC transporter permease [Citricoccus muralis]
MTEVNRDLSAQHQAKSGAGENAPTATTADFITAVRNNYGGFEKLHPVAGRPRLGIYLKQLWQRRHFIWLQSRSRVITGTDDSRLGSVWLVLRPILDAVFYWMIFGLLLRFDRGMSNYVAYVIIGVFMYQFTSYALTAGTRTITSSLALTRAFQFPRMALPVADLVYDTMQRMLAVAVMFMIIMIIPPHELPEWSWLLFPAVLALQLILSFGFMLILARLSTHLPDISRIMQFVTRFLMYGSGVIFPITRVTQNYPALEAIIELNPIYVFLVMYREILIDGVVPATEHWIMLSIWAGVTFIIGFFVFWLGEESYGRDQHK